MKRLIFITEMHQIPQLICCAEKGDVVVSLKREITDILESRKIKSRCLEDYPQPSEEYALRWMKEWPYKNLNGKTFAESLIHNNLSIWWLMENWLYYSSVYFDCLRNVMLFLQTIETILKQERPDEIVFADDGKINSEILKLFAEYNRKIIPMKLFKFVYNIRRHMKVFFISGFIDFGFSIRKLLWNLTRPLCKETKGKILLISTYEWGLVKNSSGRYTEYDPFIDPIISEMKNKDVITVNIPVGRLLGLKQMLNNSRIPSYKILESYYSRDVGNGCKKAFKSILSGWGNLKRERNFTESFKYRNKNIWPLVEKQFSAYFFSRLKGHLRDAELMKAMIEKEQPKIVVYPAETSEFGRTLFHLCNLYRIPSVGVQHGVFNNYLACVHKKGESLVGVASPNNCPIPTKTFVYGPKYKRMLYDGNYPSGSVIITGSQRFDRIVLGRENFNKRQFCKNLGIDDTKKIIAFVTSPVAAGDTEVMTSAVMEAAKKIDAQLVIKLHPSENFNIYRRVASEARSNAVIVRDIDLYEVLDACDIMITHLSTAAIEAMIFDKPVVVLNLTGKPDRIDYAKRGAAFGVYKKEDLLPTIRKLLFDRSFYAKRRKQVRSFVFDTAYMADGRSGRRMAKVIENLAKKNKS